MATDCHVVQPTSLRRLFMANGGHSPFEAASLDVAVRGRVFPHLDAKGDTFL
jgi:hypothetical protein